MMLCRVRIVVFLALFVASNGIIASVHAQSSQGRISGRVVDATGAVIPGARVAIENLATHIIRQLVANATGDYAAPSIDPGSYKVSVEAANFKTAVRESVLIEVANDLRLDFTLRPGAASEIVEVQGDAPLVESTNVTLSGVLSNKAINELPLQGRDFQNLLPLHPGVQRTPGGGFHSITSNGNRPDDNNFVIDGATDTDAYYGTTVINEEGVQGTPASHLPLDAIQEFNTQENPSADFGQKPGVVVNIGLKSGTNGVHGTAYYFHRNSALDARNYFNPGPDPASALLLHQFGASVGGPIRKDKWFYFAAYEGTRHKVGNPFAAASPVTVSIGDPTRSLVDARAAALVDFGSISPVSDQIAKLFLPNPGGTFDPNNPELINFDFNNVNREDNLVVRSDYHPNEHNAIAGRWVFGNSVQTEEDAVPLRADFLSLANTKAQVYGGDWTWTPNSSWTNQLRGSYNRFYQRINTVDHNRDPNAFYGINTGVTDPVLFGLPRITPGSLFDYLGGNSGWPLFTKPSGSYAIADTLALSQGRHNLRMGASYNRGAVDYLRGNYGRGRIDFRNLERFYAGSVRRGRILVGDLARNIHQSAFAGFVQDDYRVTPRVTLNLGLRYDLTLPIKEDNNLIANFVPDQGLVQVGHGISQPYQTNFKNLSPRAGVAWDLHGTGKTVLRAGFGIIYTQPSIRTFINSGGLNLNPSGVDGVTPGNGTINTFLRFLGGGDINWTGDGTVFDFASGSSSCSFDSPCDVFGVDQHLRSPYVENWTLNLQHQIAADTVLQVAYVGNKGTLLYRNRDINQVDYNLDDGGEQLGRPLVQNCGSFANAAGSPRTVVRKGAASPLTSGCFPYIGFLTYLDNGSSSIYNGLQVTLTKRYSKGLYLLAGYTFAHAIDTATSNLASVPQNSLNYAAERGNGDNDIRNRFTLSATYEPPSFEAPLQMGQGWQLTSVLSLEGGEPFTLSDGSNDISGTGELTDRWNITGPASNVTWLRPGSASHYYDFSSPDRSPQACVNAQPDLDQLTNYGCYVFGSTVLTPPEPGQFGNLGRNTFRGPAFMNWDVSVSKVWKLNERTKMQFRGEFFNVVNHANFSNGSIHSDFGDLDSLGLARATPDVWAANPVVGSGGSRHVQLGVKLIF